MAEKKGWFPNIMKSVRGALGTSDEEEAEAARQSEAEAEKSEPAPESVAAAPAPAPEAPLAEAPAKKAPAKKAPAKKAPAKKAPAKKAPAKKAPAKQAAKEAEALREIKIPEQSVDIRAVRESMDLTQAEFAKAYGFSIHTLRKWEQGVREPEKPTRILLMMIRDKPEVVNAYLDEISLK